MGRHSSLVPAAAILLAVLAGCGDEAAQEPSNPDETATTTAATPNEPELREYLLRADELSGVTPAETPRTDSSVPPGLPSDGARTLRRSGFITSMYQPAFGEYSGGVSSVMLFETEAGAREWMAYETSARVIRHLGSGPTFKRFGVREVPGARGWTGLDLHGNAIGHVYWTQGRCMMLVGLEVEGPRVRPLSAAARAIYERTGGTCPD